MQDKDTALKMQILTNQLARLQDQVTKLNRSLIEVTDKVLRLVEWQQDHELGHALPSENEVPSKSEIADW